MRKPRRSLAANVRNQYDSPQVLPVRGTVRGNGIEEHPWASARPGAIRFESRVHLDPELRAPVQARAAADDATTSEHVIATMTAQ